VRKIKAGDYVVIALVTGLIVVLFSLTYGFSGSERSVEIIGSDMHEIYDVDASRVVDVEGPVGITRIIIEDGRAWVEDSDCREKICVKMGTLSRPGEQAVCLPNRVVVQMKGESGGVDGVSR
jgi:hypothetical protein